MRQSSTSMNWEVCFPMRKMEFWTHCEFYTYHRIFGLKKYPGYLYCLFDFITKQTICETKTLQVQVYKNQWFHDEQGAKCM